VLGDEIGLRWTLAGVGALLVIATVWFGVIAPKPGRPAQQTQTSVT
jgi:hypothetical protein